MSAFYSMPYPDRIEILTDGAVYSEDGTLLSTREKVWRVDRIPMAIVGRGEMDVLDRLAAHIVETDSNSFDETIATLSGWIDLLGLSSRDIPLDRHIEVLIAGVSETVGPCHYFWTTHSGYPGIEPFKLAHVPTDIGGGGALGPSEMAPLGLTTEKVEAGLAGFGADLMELMRRKKMPNPTKPGLPPLYGIGGHVDLTVVRAGSVTTRRLRTWPDVVGQKIDPRSAVLVAA